jgi:hypothetical protein
METIVCLQLSTGWESASSTDKKRSGIRGQKNRIKFLILSVEF